MKITRGHNYTLVKKQSRLDVRKYSLSQRTINVGNKLSTDCVHANSVNVFKNVITLTFRTRSLMIQKFLHQINLILLIMLTKTKLRIPSHQRMEETTKGIKQLRDQT